MSMMVPGARHSHPTHEQDRGQVLSWEEGCVPPASVPRRTIPWACYHILAELGVFRRGRHVAAVPVPALRRWPVVDVAALPVAAVTDNLHCGARPDRATQRLQQVLLVPGHDDQGAHPGGCGVAGE
jgi:hypothetical protein